METTSEYEFDNLDDCVLSGLHLTLVDSDGYCELCGHQESSSNEYDDGGES